MHRTFSSSLLLIKKKGVAIHNLAGNEFQNGNDLSENAFAKKSNFAVWISDRERDEDEGYKVEGEMREELLTYSGLVIL